MHTGERTGELHERKHVTIVLNLVDFLVRSVFRLTIHKANLEMDTVSTFKTETTLVNLTLLLYL